MRLEMPWPPSALSPNARKKHLHNKTVRNQYKRAWWAIAKQAGVDLTDRAHVEITFHPPDNRRRDLDNMLAAIKYGMDGLALAAGEDDYQWRSMFLCRSDKVKGGLVVVTLHVDW